MASPTSPSSQPPPPSHSQNPSGTFAYQRRILERASPLSKGSGSQPALGVLSPPPPSLNAGPLSREGSARWVPRHRSSQSVGDITGKWENRARDAEAGAGAQGLRRTPSATRRFNGLPSSSSPSVPFPSSSSSTTTPSSSPPILPRARPLSLHSGSTPNFSASSVSALKSLGNFSPAPTLSRARSLSREREEQQDPRGTLGVGRRRGGHLGRIASGDGGEDWDERERPGGWEVERDEGLEGSLRIPGITEGAEDVVGMPGRVRLSRSTSLSSPSRPSLPPTPTAPAPPARSTPSSTFLHRPHAITLDKQRHLLAAYEYLCHISEAIRWIEACLEQPLGMDEVQVEEGLRDGVVLFRLGQVWGFGEGMEGGKVGWENVRRRGERGARRCFEHPKLQFRHSDNINYFFEFLRTVELGENFTFELTDLYEKKNMPKVIYCIHALSFLLAQRGVAPRIGSLKGQLEFTDDQLQQTQRNLDASGVPMPNFGGLAEKFGEAPPPPPEPVETEEERIARELAEAEESIVACQAQARGWLVRERALRRRVRLRLAEKTLAAACQAPCRGALVRRRVAAKRESARDAGADPEWATGVQARVRGYLARREWDARREEVNERAAPTVVKLQAQMRGVLARRYAQRRDESIRRAEPTVRSIQALARGALARRQHRATTAAVSDDGTRTAIVALQARARGALVRERFRGLREEVAATEKDIVGLQASARGALVRRAFGEKVSALRSAEPTFVGLQAACLAEIARRRLLDLVSALKDASASVVPIQAHGRGTLLRRAVGAQRAALSAEDVVRSIVDLQALARGLLLRRTVLAQAQAFEAAMPSIVALQARARGALVRRDHTHWRAHLARSHAPAVTLQSVLRGHLQRVKHGEKVMHYRSNWDKIVKLQALYRGKEKRDAFRQLTMGKNVPLGTVKEFVHLLDDSDCDFEEEIQLVDLRKRVFEAIRGNQVLEADVEELDVKIALVVKNALSFDELVKAARRHSGTVGHTLARGATSILAAHGDPFSQAGQLDKQTLRKLELYQQLFWRLQTQPEYLARLFFRMSRIELSDRHRKLVEGVVMSLFGYTQSAREEYHFLKLLQRAMHEEIAAARSLSDIVRGNFVWVKILMQYLRGPEKRTYLVQVLGPRIEEIIGMDAQQLDLESDPVVIWKKMINDEEVQTGVPSRKPKDVTYDEAIADSETRVVFIQHLQQLRQATESFREDIQASTKRMPFGIRYIARELYLALRIKFKDESEAACTRAIGQLIYYRYLNPAIVTPETFAVIPTVMGNRPRKNLAEISKMLTQLAIGTLFGDENPYLVPLNEYISDAAPKFARWFTEVADVADAESQFNADEFLDHNLQHKPSIHISPQEIYDMHSLLNQHLDALAPDAEDPLRVILGELGGAPLPASGELDEARRRAISLTLANRSAQVEDPDAARKSLWVQAKRHVLAVLRVQPEKNLTASFIAPVTEEHEYIWADFVRKEAMLERTRKRSSRLPPTPFLGSGYKLDDIRQLRYREVKARAIECCMQLEAQGELSRHDHYQGILNAIALDVRSRNRKRLQRQKELRSMETTLKVLAEKKEYLDMQHKAFHDYIEQSMKTMQKKGKKRFVMPFSRQWVHLRDIKQSGRKTPKFGSYKYSAQDLYDRGLLLSIDQTSPRQFANIYLTFSSDEVGVFTVEITHAGVPGVVKAEDLRLEDILQFQFENKSVISLCEGAAKVNLNILLFQLYKKFYV